MTDTDTLEERLRAVERALADADGATEQGEEQSIPGACNELEERVEALESQVTDLEAATQAVRGYVGRTRSINEDVEDRVDAALATVDDVEERVRALEDRQVDSRRQPADERSSDHDRRTADRNTGTGPQSDGGPANAVDDRDSPGTGEGSHGPAHGASDGPARGRSDGLTRGRSDGAATREGTRGPSPPRVEPRDHPETCPYCSHGRGARNHDGAVAQPVDTVDDADAVDDVDERGLVERIRSSL